VQKNPNFDANALNDFMYAQTQGIVDLNVDSSIVRDPGVVKQSPHLQRGGFYSNLGIPGSGNIYTGEPMLGQEKPARLTEEEWKAKKAGLPSPTPRGPAVTVHAYDLGNGAFHDATVAANPVLLQQVEREQEIYNKMLAMPEASIREKLNTIGSVLDPEFRTGLIREAAFLQRNEKIDEVTAAKRVLSEKADFARRDVQAIREVLKKQEEEAKKTSALQPGPGRQISQTRLQDREAIMSELDRDPAVRRLVMQMLDTEGGGVATMEALTNRVAMIRQRIPDWTIGKELRSGFYGPINRGYAQTLKLHPDSVARYQRDIDIVRAGSNLIRGRTDQGSKNDPNVSGPGRVRIASNPHEVYNYWQGRRRGAKGWVNFSHADSARFAGEA
jgi:hypothetical protein